VLDADFLPDVWNDSRFAVGCETLLKNSGVCPVYEI
jgi:hypothetical protein